MTYSVDYDKISLGAATYVDRLLRGAKVSELPMQYTTKFSPRHQSQGREGVWSSCAASMLVRADEVVE
jgi:putative ABC transport system substrate-binding protein